MADVRDQERRNDELCAWVARSGIPCAHPRSSHYEHSHPLTGDAWLCYGCESQTGGSHPRRDGGDAVHEFGEPEALPESRS